MKILVAGSSGQVGIELMRQGAAKHEMIGMTHETLDITDSAKVMATVMAEMPDMVVNAAAYTAVDDAESETEACFAVNSDGPKNLAQACSLADIPLIHISTDYVFDGTKSGSYIESDRVSPVGVYGKSKAEGEENVCEGCTEHIILRTSWVFSAHGNNFVKTMLRLGAEREELGIVADQYGCPSSAAELARAIYNVLDTDLDGKWGVYHFCQPEPTTWFAFAKAVFDTATKQGIELKVNSVNSITTEDYPTPAKRPANSVMDCSRFSQAFGFDIKPWSESLQEVIKELKRA